MHKSGPWLGQAKGRNILILSDTKPGHVNQSIAFAKLLGLDYEVQSVSFRNRFCKALSYLLDRVGIYSLALLKPVSFPTSCSLVVSAGSGTYYANKVISRAVNAACVAIMLPRSYRYDFDLIVAQQHDRPPVKENILTVPVNLSFPEPQGLVSRIDSKPCVSVIIGGPSRHFMMNAALIKEQLQQIYKLFPDADFLVTTSRRTPSEVEKLVKEGPFRYRVIASQEEINPIADFLAISDYVFVTEDSTSMISEAVCFGDANVEVLPLIKQGSDSKIQRMTKFLADEGCLHIFDGFYGSSHRKVDLAAVLGKVWP